MTFREGGGINNRSIYFLFLFDPIEGEDGISRLRHVSTTSMPHLSQSNGWTKTVFERSRGHDPIRTFCLIKIIILIGCLGLAAKYGSPISTEAQPFLTYTSLTVTSLVALFPYYYPSEAQEPNRLVPRSLCCDNIIIFAYAQWPEIAFENVRQNTPRISNGQRWSDSIMWQYFSILC